MAFFNFQLLRSWAILLMATITTTVAVTTMKAQGRPQNSPNSADSTAGRQDKEEPGRTSPQNSGPAAINESQRSQTIHSQKGQPKIPRSLGVWHAGARNAPLRTRYGMIRERSLYITGIRWTRAIKTTRHGTWSYTHDILPSVVATKTPFYRDTSFRRTVNVVDKNGVRHQVEQRIDSLIPTPKTVYGVGWVPLGVRFTTSRPRWAQASFGISGGGLYFNKPMPDPMETRFNFTLDAVAIATIPITKKHRLNIGYQFNHISNANSGRSNPGVNTQMWHFGWSYAR